jgi:hypothetical protein
VVYCPALLHRAPYDLDRPAFHYPIRPFPSTPPRYRSHALRPD